jgi:hypothetical protein
MPLRFAAARLPAQSPMARALTRTAIGQAANDHGPGIAAATGMRDPVLQAALRHFAAHGVGAAAAAKGEAERALSAGDEQGYEWWLGICHRLDRRLARQLARRHSPMLGDPAALAHS